MPVTLSFEIYEAFEKALGKEEARKVVKSLEAAISEATEYQGRILCDTIYKIYLLRSLSLTIGESFS